MKDGKKGTILIAGLIALGAWALSRQPSKADEATIPGETKPLSPGGVFQVSNLIAPREEFIGIPSNIICTVTNIGSGYGGYIAELKVDGIITDSQQVDLYPGKDRDISFGISGLTLGTHTISIGGLSATVEIVGRPTAGGTPEQTAEEIVAAEAELEKIKEEAEAAWGDEIVAQAVVTGKIVSMGSGKVTTATVTVDGHSSKTDGSSGLGSGFYRAGPLPAGTYDITASALGYITQTMKRALSVNENVVNFDLYPSDYYTLVAEFQAAHLRLYGEEFIASPSTIYQKAKAWASAPATSETRLFRVGQWWVDEYGNRVKPIEFTD
uniref:Putative cell adhesion n=1 Tax=viral metagenome TaxID=1070528 RepID=A0A6M3LI78_9ZZZZ